MTFSLGTLQRRNNGMSHAMYGMSWEDRPWHPQGLAWSDRSCLAQYLVLADESSRAALRAKAEERAWMHHLADEYANGVSQTRLATYHAVERGVAIPSSSLPLRPQPASQTTEELKESIIERLDEAEDVNLWKFLVCVKQHLMVFPDATDRAVGVGHMIPDCIRSWMAHTELRLCRILKCYPKDFYVYEEDSDVYIQCLHRTHRTMFTFVRPTTAGRVVRL
eukprot:TRINITY_DN42221_c0_g1_i3.p1 TRINITY_DN42221_c0_g1~~TRINITY_DN42221_c0_g1_i3.p1  ORF type:complete len:221 (-),score=27.03 TRINITY_DN42221_c0_g1_i3:364-1026(-)